MAITPQLRGQIQMKGEWPYFFAKGKRPLAQETIQQMLSLMSNGSGRTVLAYVLTFVGVIGFPSKTHLDFTPKVNAELGRILPLPEDFKVRL